MKTIAVVLVNLLICVPTFSFAQSCNSIGSIDWLLGYWVADDGESITIEHWKKVSPQSFEGYGESRNKLSNERQSGESLRLVEMANELFYLAKPEQNDFPVAFKLTQCSRKNAVFENSTHDFPKKLDYQLGLNNKMKVTVSGEKGKSFDINFIRRDES
ncbi:MAG: hypothetical protein JKX81_01480 [Arenicella sp.]|nr:hypothetical protein [Arenicella sp.]